MKAAKVTVKVAKESVETAATNVARSDRFGRFAAQSSHFHMRPAFA